jgi:hypothetical protein
MGSSVGSLLSRALGGRGDVRVVMGSSCRQLCTAATDILFPLKKSFFFFFLIDGRI